VPQAAAIDLTVSRLPDALTAQLADGDDAPFSRCHAGVGVVAALLAAMIQTATCTIYCVQLKVRPRRPPSGWAMPGPSSTDQH